MTKTGIVCLENLIENSGLRINAIASKMGMSRQNFHLIRQNPKKMTADQMERLAFALGVEIEMVFEAVKNFH